MTNLNHFELELLVQLCKHYWKPEDRERIARALPEIYAKLTDTRVIVDTQGRVKICAVSSAAEVQS